MRTILSRGLRIPDDIADVGFDDIEDSKYSFPSLTTISPDKREIARLAVAQRFHRLKGDTSLPGFCHVGSRLVERESTRADINTDERMTFRLFATRTPKNRSVR